MTITAKFPSVCPACKNRIVVGSQVEWSKGAPARHVTCAQTPPPVRVQEHPDDNGDPVHLGSPTAKTAKTSKARRPLGWRPCGYPGCNPGYCDECDGEGYRHGR